jgi:hypothetical protein
MRESRHLENTGLGILVIEERSRVSTVKKAELLTFL